MDAVDELYVRARDLFAARHYDQSIALLRQGIEADAEKLSLHIALGAACHGSGQLAEALDVLSRAVRLHDGCGLAHDNLAVVLGAVGRIDEALFHHQRAVALDGDSARAHVNYALTLEAIGAAEPAWAAFRRAADIDARMVEAQEGMGRWHLAGEVWEVAERHFRRALDESAQSVGALVGMATVMSKTGRHRQAIRLARKATRVAPDQTRAMWCLAEVLATARRGYEALDVYRQLERAGVHGVAIDAARASVLSTLGRYGAALRLYRRVLKTHSNSPLRGPYLFALHATAKLSDRGMLRELKRWEHFRGASRATARHRHDRNLDRDRRIRIGYLSPDFRQHVVRQFFEPVMLVHDADQFEFHCYSEARHEDHATAELKAVADRWYRTRGVSDAEVAARIDHDQIDILVDLAGHTANNRLGVLIRRPAPVQATYLGYFGSTGLSSVDYWITDPVVCPPGSGEPATETIYRLPRCGFCYGPPGPVTDEVEDARSTRSTVVFGCFNNVAKVNFEVVDTWVRILEQVPKSRLLLKDPGFEWGRNRSVSRGRFARRGIDPRRIELEAASPHGQYLARYRHIDIALDPFPRTGGTTTCDALWLGVPVISLAGARYVERLSAAKLVAVGLDELIARSKEEYVDLAVSLARDRARLAAYHRTIQGRMAASPLCDPVSLARALEDAYRSFWHAYVDKTSDGV